MRPASSDWASAASVASVAPSSGFTLPESSPLASLVANCFSCLVAFFSRRVFTGSATRLPARVTSAASLRASFLPPRSVSDAVPTDWLIVSTRQRTASIPMAVSKQVSGGSVVDVVGGTAVELVVVLATLVDDVVGGAVDVLVEVLVDVEVEVDVDDDVLVVDPAVLVVVEVVVGDVDVEVDVLDDVEVDEDEVVTGTVDVVVEVVAPTIVVDEVEVVVLVDVEDEVVVDVDEEVDELEVDVDEEVDVEVLDDVEVDEVDVDVDEVVDVVVDVVAPGSEVDVVELLLVEVDELEDVDEDDDVELLVVVEEVVDVLVVVVVVVVVQLTPQHGNVRFCVGVAAGVTTAPPRTFGAVVRHSNRFAAVAVRWPATVSPVLALKKIVPAGSPPGPVAITSPAGVTLIWQASISIDPPRASG